MKDHQNDPALAEAIARRDESRAQIMRARASRAGGTATDRLASAFEKLAEQATKDARRSPEAAADIEPPARDLSGTAPTLSDSAGNFAPNPEVARAGGIGIDASNTNPETGEPAKTAEEAGVATRPGAQKVVGDQVVDDGPTGRQRTAETAEGWAAVGFPANGGICPGRSAARLPRSSATSRSPTATRPTRRSRPN